MEIKLGDGWSPAYAITRALMSMFCPNYEKCGTIGGLYKMDMSESIEIVAIHNECPHNGDFQRFMDELESLARRQKKARQNSLFYE